MLGCGGLTLCLFAAVLDPRLDFFAGTVAGGCILNKLVSIYRIELIPSHVCTRSIQEWPPWGSDNLSTPVRSPELFFIRSNADMNIYCDSEGQVSRPEYVRTVQWNFQCRIDHHERGAVLGTVQGHHVPNGTCSDPLYSVERYLRYYPGYMCALEWTGVL